MNNGSVFCRHHNGGVLCSDLTSTRTPFFAPYLLAESGALDSNKLEEKEALHFVPDVTLCNLCSTPRGSHMGYRGNVQKCAKTAGCTAIQSGHVSHV